MSTTRLEQNPSTIKLVKSTQEHLDSSVCPITQESFKIGEIRAICNNCLTPFLARALLTNFIRTKRSICPICKTELQQNDLKLPKLEEIRLRIDSIKGKISLYEIDLARAKKSLKQLSKTSQNLFSQITIEEELSSDGDDFDLKEFDSSSLNKSNELEKALKTAKEGEIKALKDVIQNYKKQLDKLNEGENKIVSSKNSEINVAYYSQLVKTSLAIAGFSIVLITSFVFMHNKFYSIDH